MFLKVNFLKITKKWWLSFFLVYSGVVVWKFFGLVFSEGLLPGGDTLGHFFAFTEYSNALSQGYLYSYSNAWFGGIPLFHFYSPLLFLLMFLVKTGFGWIMTDETIFRSFVFFSFALFPLPFYFFLKEFFNEKIAKIGIWLSFLWIFYPKILGSLGIGAGGAVFYGLFNQVFTVYLFLLYFVFLKRILDDKGFNKKNIIFGSLLLSSIFLSHLLSAVAVVIFSFLFFLYKKDNFLFFQFKKIFLLTCLSFFFSAWWLIPFLATLQYQSGNFQTLSTYLTSPLVGLFPFDLSQLVRGQFLEFGYLWLLFFVCFIFGFWVLVKNKKLLFPYLFVVGFFLLATDFFSTVFPEVPFHYYRFIPYIFLFELIIAAVGLEFIWVKLETRWYFSYILIIIFLVASSLFFWSYNLGKGSEKLLISTRLARLNSDVDYYYSLNKYEMQAEAQEVVRGLQNFPSQPFRVLTDMQQIWFMQNLSSMHYFNTFLPLANQQAVLNGLYAESAWQLPFIFPVIGKVTNANISWGRVEDLSQNQFFITQPMPSMLQRLALFGVDYFLQAGQPRADLQNTSSTVNFIGNTDHFSLFYLADAKNKVYTPPYLPGVFYQCKSGPDEFRKFSLGWYSVVENLDHPIIDGGVISEKNYLLDEKNIGFVVLLMSEKNETCINLVSTTEKPILFLNTSDTYFGVTNAEHNHLEIKDFKPVAHYDNRGVWTQPNVAGLQEMSDFILNHQQVLEKSDLQLTDWENNKVSFTGSGPVIVNLSYFPYWQSSSGKVYPVTPGQMLVIAKGETVLEYKGGLDTKIGLSLSILSYIFVLGYFIVGSVLRKKNNK